jgi:NlpC/P60 family putative phage cell wall peptidase
MTPDLVAELARGWVGTPYRHRAALKGIGCDCLGLVRGVWRELHGSEPMVVPAYRAGPRDPVHAGALEAAAQRLLVLAAGPPAAGQVVLFRLAGLSHPKHCGILIGPNRFVHAQEGLGVVEANLTDGWRRRIAGRFDFPQPLSKG